MIAEAFDTAVTLGLALLAWIALTAAVATAGLVSLCVAVVWVCRGVWRGVAASLAAVGVSRAVPEVRSPQGAADGRTRPRAPSDGPCAGLSWRESAPQGSGAPFSVPDTRRPPQTRTARPAPAWARTDKDTA